MYLRSQWQRGQHGKDLGMSLIKAKRKKPHPKEKIKENQVHSKRIFLLLSFYCKFYPLSHKKHNDYTSERKKKENIFVNKFKPKKAILSAKN